MKWTSKTIAALLVILMFLPTWNVNVSIKMDKNEKTVQKNSDRPYTRPSNLENPVLIDEFDSFPGYNQTIWNYESYGDGSVGWVDGSYFEMNASRHSFRTLSSVKTFEVGHEAIIRMKLLEEEAVVCVGWTNQTATTEWNYLFGPNSVLLQGALSTILLERVTAEPAVRISKMLSGVNTTIFHDYRLVWNSSVLIAYVDDIRMNVIGDMMPSGPLHFKIAITEFRNVTTEGSVILDSIVIREHHSMITESPPFISLDSPGNNSMNLAGEPIDITPVGHNGTLFWSWDGAVNRSSEEPYAIHMPSATGGHTLDVYCLDGYGYDTWASARFVFNTMGNPPILIATRITSPPVIDGVIHAYEWPSNTVNALNLVRMDGIILPVNIMIGSDDRFIYVAFDSPVTSGHDSRAALIVDGSFNGVYEGHNGTPTMSIWYHKGSPDAWEGYDEIHALVSSDDGHITNFRITSIPTGFMSMSSDTGHGVQYEFRLPLEEFNAQPGSSLGISLMLYPSGMGVHSLFYPLIKPLENASKLAVLIIPSSIPIVVIFGVSVGFVALISYFGWKRRIASSSVAVIESEDSMRVLELIQSYDEITLQRLSIMTGLSEEEVREKVNQLAEKRLIKVEISHDGTIRRRS